MMLQSYLSDLQEGRQHQECQVLLSNPVNGNHRLHIFKTDATVSYLNKYKVYVLCTATRWRYKYYNLKHCTL